ncbi:MAG: hypothetical protein ACK4WH_02265 [Phycisphaerales bacterium]
MPRRERQDFARIDLLESRTLLDAPGLIAHQPAGFNPNLSAADIEEFMSGEDAESMAAPDSGATTDDDLYAAFRLAGDLLRSDDKPVPLSARARPTLGKGVIADRSWFDDMAWERDRTDEPLTLASAPSGPDDQTPIITAAAHGDEKAIAILLSWNDDADDLGSSVVSNLSSSSGKSEPSSFKIHSSFVGEFPSKSLAR